MAGEQRGGGGERSGDKALGTRLPIVTARGVESFHESRGISYTTAKDIIKDKLGVFFDDLSKLGTHSLRSGGASDSGCQIYAESQRLEMRSVKEQVH